MFQHTEQHIKHRPMCCPETEGRAPLLFRLSALKSGVSTNKEIQMKTLFCFLLLTLSAILPSHAQQAIDSHAQFASEEQSALYRKLLREIRCPTCQNQDIAESNAPLAKQLRNLITQQIQSGKSADEITQYLIDRYGDFITYAPRVQKNTLVLWFSPALIMLLALGFWLMQRKRSNTQAQLSLEQMAQLEQWLNQYGKVRS